MSSALVRQSLEFVESDPKAKVHNKGRKSKGVFDLIPTAHRYIKTVNRSGKIEKKPIFNVGERGSNKSRKPTQTTEAVINDNLRKIGILGSSSIKEDIAEKIVKRARSGKAVVEIEEEKPDEGTVFTEEDFRNFEKDYFCS